MECSLTKQDFVEIIKQRMGERRFTHSLNVAKMAVKLAKKYNCDVEKAEICGILHDCCKETPKDEMLQIIKNGGIILDDTEIISPKLWHAIAGSCYVKNVLKIEDTEILDAIKYHTTGRENMSTFEKIIFLADCISEERVYSDVDIVREIAFADIDSAMLYVLKYTISSLLSKNSTIHHNTVKCYNGILADFIKNNERDC